MGINDWNNWATCLIAAIIMSYLPDIDHLFYMFMYRRNSEYGKNARRLLLSRRLSDFIEYVRMNHKYNTGIISHNVLSPIIFFALTYVSLFQGNMVWVAVYLSGTMHFVYDILEDLLYFGKLNGNWFLRFGAQSQVLGDNFILRNHSNLL